MKTYGTDACAWYCLRQHQVRRYIPYDANNQKDDYEKAGYLRLVIDTATLKAMTLSTV